MTALLVAGLLVPIIGSGLATLLAPHAAVARVLVAAATILHLAIVMALSALVAAHGPVSLGAWLRVDALSALQLLVVSVALLAALACPDHGIASTTGAEPTGVQDRAILLALGSPLGLTLVADHLGLLWLGLVLEVPLTALLLGRGRIARPEDAAWRYSLHALQAAALGLVATLLVYSASRGDEPTLAWSHLVARGARLDATTLHLAFLFAVVGYLARAVVVPFHSWLVDADNSVPTPLAVFHTVAMVNIGLYAIMRFGALGPDPSAGTSVLFFFGIMTVVIAALAMLAADSWGRILAYSSSSLAGTVLVALGIGGDAVLGAMLLMLGHGLARAAVALGQAARGGAAPVDSQTGEQADSATGSNVLLAPLALGYAPPAAPFAGLLALLAAGYGAGRMVVTSVVAASALMAFIGLARASHNISGRQPASAPLARSATALVAILVTGAIVLGIFIPRPFDKLLGAAARATAGAVVEP